jgi:hypothetical protein
MQQRELQTALGDAHTTDATSPPDQLLQDVVGQTPTQLPRVAGIAVGTFDGLAEDGSVFVSIASLNLSRIRARSIAPVLSATLGDALAIGFEGNDPHKPIVLGVMLEAPFTPIKPEQQSASAQVDVMVDGERVVLKAEHEIELRCGEAAIVLTADGRIQLRGTYITSHASATQRILGGSVNIN